MKNSFIRISLSLIAICIGAALMYLFTLLGDKTLGPLSKTMEKTNRAAMLLETKLAQQQRKHKRADELNWFYSYRFNHKALLNPPHMLLGTHDNSMNETFKGVIDLENGLNTHFPIMHIYNAWGNLDENKFPSEMVDAITALGSIPLITWEPWLNGFYGNKFDIIKPLEKRNQQGLTDIAKGRYDEYIITWAKELRSHHGYIFLRLGHEMNDPYRYPWGPQNNRPQDFVVAWQHVHNLFTRLGVTNVIWVWNPHPAYGYFTAYYPGDKYVDYVGADVLNFGTAATWSQWWSFEELFGQHYMELAKFNKPIMITEFGSLSKGGNRAAWYRDALQDIKTKYPAIKSLVFYHVSDDNTSHTQTFSWYFIQDKNVLTTIKSNLN